MGMMIEADAAELIRRTAHAYESQAGADLPPLPGEPEPVDPAQEWEGTITLVVALLSPMLPYLPTVYTPTTIKALSAAIVPVADKYDLNVGGLLAGPEIGLLMVAAPLGMMTYAAHKQWRAETDAARTMENAPEPIVEVTPRQSTSRLGDNMEDNGGRLSAA